MNGFLTHFLTTLKLNLRNKQAMIFGYLVPVFFLIAFGSLYKTRPALVREIGQILTISVLGGACFGMPVALVSERERGVWRRYRLMPISPLWLLASTMLARYVIVLTSALLQIGLAMWWYKMPAPENPFMLWVAFSCTAFAFLGLGLIIAAVSNTTGAVQAMGQVVFLPMIIIGGVGVAMRLLPVWAQYVATFLPGRYAVEAMNAGVMVLKEDKDGLQMQRWYFHLGALLVMGIATSLIGAKLFRWESAQRLPRSTYFYVFAGLLLWACVGGAALHWNMARIFVVK
ncbi:MAG TPA: ABC transporter permease [Planctomycetota bacterium]|nr:ABC transporter permease [Planctomycetota bacterium]